MRASGRETGLASVNACRVVTIRQTVSQTVKEYPIKHQKGHNNILNIIYKILSFLVSQG